MVSKDEQIALEALRHFKEGQLYAWVNDEEEADQHFDKCLRAIRLVEQQDYGKSFNLEPLARQARSAPRKKDETREAIKLRQTEDWRALDSISSSFDNVASTRIKMTYTVVPIASNRLELRALIHLPWKHLSTIARSYIEKEQQRQIVDERYWQWIEVDQTLGFIGTFHLTYSNGVLFGQIVAHSFFDDTTLEIYSKHIANLIVLKFQKNSSR